MSSRINWNQFFDTADFRVVFSLEVNQPPACNSLKQFISGDFGIATADEQRKNAEVASGSKKHPMIGIYPYNETKDFVLIIYEPLPNQCKVLLVTKEELDEFRGLNNE